MATPAEVVAADRYLDRWRWRGGVLAAAAVALAFAGALVDDLGAGAWLVAPVAFAVVAWGVWRAPAVAARRAGPPPEQRLLLSPEALVHEQAGVRTRVRWSAVAPVRRPEGLYLRQDRAVIFVPERVLPAGLATRVSAFREGGPPAAPTSPPPEGYDGLVVAYRATAEDYQAFARRVEGRGGLALMPYAAGALLVGSVIADRGLDPLALVAVLGWTLLLVLSGVAQQALRRWRRPWRVARRLEADPERLPRGPVTVGLGPEGGWVDSPRGVWVFAWAEVRHVDADAHAVVLLFGEELGTVLPARALEGRPLEDVVAAIERWRREAPTRGTRAARGQVPDPAPHPFAPPRVP